MRAWAGALGLMLAAAAPQASLKDFMQHVIEPQADVVWAASGTVVDPSGEHDLAPKTPAAWARARRAALGLTRSGEQLLSAGRIQPGATWARQARAVTAISLAAARAAQAHDEAAMLKLGGDLHDACEECHRVYVLGEAPR